MQTIEVLGIALGLGTLAGLNLYLTVFVAGLAIRMHWVVLAPPFHGLEVLSDPLIIGIAGTLYLVEFAADKIPWVDTAWDAVHTVIRPVGAMALALAAVGTLHPIFEIIAVLLAGGMALSTHTAKAGTRLVANASPEPVSNIGLSIAEDGIVLGGLALIAWNPVVALAASVLTAAIILAVLPRLVRGIRTKLWFAWKKLNTPATDATPAILGDTLPAADEVVLRRSHASTSPLALATRCVSGGGPRLPSNIPGWLVMLEESKDSLFFVGRRWPGRFLLQVNLQDAAVESRAGFLADKITIAPAGGDGRYVFLFERGRSEELILLMEHLTTGRSSQEAAEI